MAKQTFTTGQVLTAAQMTSLQQTAMLGGAASAKVASYTLVAADAGTAISMSNASATTITVNTGLFAAGDTVFIQNIGAGACTITAGTATVATAGSLILPQNDAGILYFTATGTATFYDFIQAGAVSPLTTKGDLYGFSTLDARIPIGTNNQVLTADSAQALGLKWATPSSGSPVNSQASVATQQSTTSQTYTDLTTSGPAVTVTTGTKALVIVSSECTNQAVNRSAFMSFAVSGASTVSANDDNALIITNSVADWEEFRASSATLVTGLTAGSNTFTAKYRSDDISSCTARFKNRNILVIDMGS